MHSISYWKNDLDAGLGIEASLTGLPLSSIFESCRLKRRRRTKNPIVELRARMLDDITGALIDSGLVIRKLVEFRGSNAGV